MAISAILAACETTYEPPGDYGGIPHGGYTDTRVDANTVIVSFSGNILTPQKTVETYLLYRCAKVTIESGFNYFVVVSTSSTPIDINVKTRTKNYVSAYSKPTMHQSYVSNENFQSYSTSRTNTQQFYQAVDGCNKSEAHAATSVIKMFQGTMPPGLPNAFNAYDVVAHLGPAI
jgi:hypothetical protein